MIHCRSRVFQSVWLLIGLCTAGQWAWADHVPFQVGHVLVSVGNGQVQHRDAAGNLLETLNTLQGGFTTGMAFDTVGNLYVTNFNAHNVRKFDSKGGLIGTFGSGYSGSPESILFDRNGNAYVGAVDGDNKIRKFDSLGNPLALFTVATERVGTDWIDLAADQCTMFYTSEGTNVKRFDVCTNTQLTNFNTSSLPGLVAYALRLLPTGGLLVANTSVIARLDSSGNLIQTYDASGENCWFALNLDPDGKSFWSADFCSSNVYKFDIATGQQLLKFNTGTPSLTVFGLVVFGEIGVGKPSILHATVGNQTVYVYWDPSREPVDGYKLFRDDGVSVITIDVPAGNDLLDTFLVNGRLYKYTLRAVKNGVEGPPSNFVLARPGELQPLAHPRNRILFLHGIASDASTWNTTSDFLVKTLKWNLGGTLRYLDNEDPRTRFPEVSSGFDAKADFFTVNFGSSFFGDFFGGAVANYDVGRPGILHQADAVQGFIRRLRAGGLTEKITIVAHSMGGLAARSYIADNADEAVLRVSQLTTYGSPHWGISPGNVLEGEPLVLFSGINPFLDWRGAQDLRVDCTNGIFGGPLDYNQEPSPERFLDQLRLKTLPSKIQYFAIQGHNDLSHQFLTPCLLDHWDGLITIDSANLGAIPKNPPAHQPSLTSNPVPLLTTSRLHTGQTRDFSSILCALDLNCFILNVRSPIDVEITAPDGRSVSRQLSEIPGASYMELADETGHLIATVLLPFAQGGNYTIRVLPKPGASPNDSYTLEIVRAGVTSIVAENQRVQDIPAQPYVVTVLPPLAVDIKPGSFPNSINPGSRGKIPVAILSTLAFNAPSRVDKNSLTFGRTGNEQSLAFCNSGGEDVNGDGLLDLVCHFNTPDTGFTPGDTQGVLKGKTVDHIPFLGTDLVRIVP